MKVNTNNESAKQGALESGALGAPDADVVSDDVYEAFPTTKRLFRRMKKGKVESHISGAVNALDSLLHKCKAQGVYIPFRHALTKPEHDANRAALALICIQLGMVETLLCQAEGEHLVSLQAELAELNRHLAKTQ